MNESMHSFHSTWGCVGDTRTELRALSVKKTHTHRFAALTRGLCADQGLDGCSGLWVWPKEEWESTLETFRYSAHSSVLSIRFWLSVEKQRTLNRADAKQMLLFPASETEEYLVDYSDSRMKRTSWHFIFFTHHDRTISEMSSQSVLSSQDN